jgi:hypothetical protein
MALNFPDSPELDEIYTDNISGFSYQWNGTLWKNYPTGSFSSVDNYWTLTNVGIHTLSNVGIGTTDPTSKLSVQGDIKVTGVATVSQIFIEYSSIQSGILTTESTSQITLAEYPTDIYRSIKMNVQVSCGSTHRISEIIVVHNNIETYITEYGSISTTEFNNEPSNLASFTSDIFLGKFRILATPEFPSLTTFKYVSSLINV